MDGQDVVVEELDGLSNEDSAERIAEHFAEVSNQYSPIKMEDLPSRAPENAGTWVHVPRHISDLEQFSFFAMYFVFKWPNVPRHIINCWSTGEAVFKRLKQKYKHKYRHINRPGIF